MQNRSNPEDYRFVIDCFLREDADPDDTPSYWQGDITIPPLERAAERLIAGGKYKLIILWGGGDEWVQLDRWPKERMPSKSVSEKKPGKIAKAKPRPAK